MPDKKNRIGRPRDVSSDNFRVSKINGDIKFWAKYNKKWYSTPLSEGFDIRNKNRAHKHSIVTYNDGNGEVIPTITAHPSGKLYIRDNQSDSKVELKNDSGKLAVDGDINLASGKTFKVNDVAISTGGIKTYSQDATPTSTSIGDIWFDTNDGNKRYRAASVGADAVTGGEWIEYSQTNVTGNAGTVTNGVYTTSKISALAATSSSELAGVISNETGSGKLVFGTSPAFVTPVLGTPASGTLTNCDGTAASLRAQATTKGDVALGNVDNTADADKPISTDTQTALNAKAPIDGATFTGTTTIPTADVNGGTIDGVTIGTTGPCTELQVDKININGNTLSTVASNFAINITPHGTGDLQLNADTIRVGDDDADVTITTQGTGDLTLNTNAGTNSGSIVIEDAANGDIKIDADGTGEIAITSPVGFEHLAATVGSTGDITDMPINYATGGNKCRLTFTGDTQTFTNLQLVFPAGVSGNFVVLVKTYSAGSVTTNGITNFLAYSGTTGDTPSAVLWPGGTKPSITNVASRMDIFSFYWDSNEEIAYGAASQGYQV